VKRSLILLLLFPVVLAAAPMTVRRVTLTGNTAFTTREVLSWMATSEGREFSGALLDADCAAIRDNYIADGYYDATIDTVERLVSGDSTTVGIRLVIAEGRRCLVGTVAVEGASVVPTAELLDLFETHSGAPLNPALLERDIDAVLRRYEQAGYPFASCSVESLARSPDGDIDRLTIVVGLSEGRRMTIDEIRVEGNRETRPEVVTRETRFAAGELYDPAKVEAIRPRLQRLNLFDDVAEPELYVRDRRGGLLIRVREGSTNTFDGVVGYVPETVPGGGGGYLTGLASVSMRNLFGTGRKFSFRWQREDRYSQELGLRYTEPWVFRQPVNVGGGFLQRKQDTTFVKRTLDLRADMMLTDALTAGVVLGTESVIPSDSTQTRVLRSSVLSIGVDVQYDTRNDPYAPSHGARYHSDYQYGSRRISNVPASLSLQVVPHSGIQRYGVDCDVYTSFIARQVLALGFHGREVRSGYLDESDMIRFGGARSLRGYREGQFLGSRIAWTTVEYRFLLSRRSFIAGFIDTGYYLRPGDEARAIVQRDDFKYGYGVGVQVETGIGIIAVSFALGEGDSFSTGKVHFGMINEF
jgi:outer membrane protein insertion porin family